MRLGIFGGTFDPPHAGHLIVAQDAWSALELDRILFIPAATPPHKQGRVAAPAEQRLAMLRAACDDDDRFVVSDIELRRAGPSYTIDTLRELREKHPDGSLFLLIGADQLRELHAWREPAEIARLATLVVLAREGPAPADAAADVPFRTLDVTRIDVSATEIRRRVAAGEPIRYLVPPGVERLIREAGLYRADAATAGRA